MEDAGVSAFPSPASLCERCFMENIYPESSELFINHRLSQTSVQGAWQSSSSEERSSGIIGRSLVKLHALNGPLCLSSIESVPRLLPTLPFHYLLSAFLLFCLYHRAFEHAFPTAWYAPSCLFPKLIKPASSSISVQASLLQRELCLLLDQVRLFPIERSHSNL